MREGKHRGLPHSRITHRRKYFQDLAPIEDEKFFWIALGLQWERETEKYPSYDWWVAFAELVRPDLEADPNLILSPLSKMAALGKIRASQTLALMTEFVNGKTVDFLDPDEPTGDE